MERTEWHRVVIFNEGLAKIAEQYLEKGAQVFVEGKIATNKWTDRDGVERYTTEIQIQPYNGTLTFLSSKKQDEGRPSTGTRAAPKREPEMAGAGAGIGTGFGGGDMDDEIPFAPIWQ